ncbi:MAG: ankyrin repeat domain-containing protein [Chloroflexota bacterium]
MDHLTESISQDLCDEFVNIAHGHESGGGLNRVREMVGQYPALVNAYNHSGDENALGAAAHMGDRSIVQFLLDKGATLDIATAAMMGWRTKVNDFLNDDPALARATGAHGHALLYYVAQSGDTVMADMILENGGGDGLKYPLKPLNTPSIFGAIYFGHLEMIQWFLDHDADLTVQDYSKRTPLEVAIDLGHKEIADLLRNHIR